MKKTFILLTLCFLWQACDPPPRARYINNTPETSNTSTDDTNTNNVSDDTTSADSNDENNSDQITDDSSSDDQGFSNCNMNYNYSLNSLGYIGLCQSSLDQRQFKFKMSQTDTTNGTCFVPIHILSNGNSFKLGTAECVHNQADKVYYMTLNKNRSEQINGIMVIRASSLNSYMQCMNAKAYYIANHPGCEYQAQCMYYAEQYAYNTCTQFKNNHYNNYKQLNL